MAASTAGALKALIESGGLGISAYRDEAPDGAPLPYVTILERIALVPNVDGRFDRDSGPHSANETVQVSLWEQWRDLSLPHKPLTESYTLSDALTRLLDGASLPVAPTLVWGVLFRSSRRLPPELDTNLVQTAITCDVVRDV